MGVGAGVRSDNRHDRNHPRLARRTEGRRAWPDLPSSSGHLCRPPRPVKPLSGFSVPRVYLDARAWCVAASACSEQAIGVGRFFVESTRPPPPVILPPRPFGAWRRVRAGLRRSGSRVAGFVAGKGLGGGLVSLHPPAHPHRVVRHHSHASGQRASARLRFALPWRRIAPGFAVSARAAAHAWLRVEENRSGCAAQGVGGRRVVCRRMEPAERDPLPSTCVPTDAPCVSPFGLALLVDFRILCYAARLGGAV